MTLLTVGQMWAEYLRAVVPSGATAVQVQECRRAFYAGAHALMHECLVRVGDDDVPVDDGAAHLEAITEELIAFRDDVLMRKA